MKSPTAHILVSILLCLSVFANAQTAVDTTVITDSSKKIIIDEITVIGNKKTKDYIIRREVQFKKGDSISLYNLATELELARQQVYNTTLFNIVTIQYSYINANAIAVNLNVEERWYIYPTPLFQPVDRNLNEWLVKYKGDLDRVNYGLRFQHYNLTGRRDALRLSLLNGYTRHISFAYTQPYSNSNLTEGFAIGAGFSQVREVIYQTSKNNKLLFYNNGKFSSRVIFASAAYILRKAIRDRHTFAITFSHINIDDTIVTQRYNPKYFNDNSAIQNIIDISYLYQYINVNNIAYPLKGETYNFFVIKRGLGLTGGINMLSVEGGYNKYIPWKKNYYFSIQSYAKLKLPLDLAYLNQRAMGFGDHTLRGLQYYVIDGAAFGYIKTTLKKKVYSFKVPFPWKFISHKYIPFNFFAKTFADAGTVLAKNAYKTDLNNKLLYTGGFGIDIVTLYDINLRFEYAFNQLGQNGLFLHFQSGF